MSGPRQATSFGMPIAEWMEILDERERRARLARAYVREHGVPSAGHLDLTGDVAVLRAARS